MPSQPGCIRRGLGNSAAPRVPPSPATRPGLEILSHVPGKYWLFVCPLTSSQPDSRTWLGVRMRARGSEGLGRVKLHKGLPKDAPKHQGCSQTALPLQHPYPNLQSTCTPLPAPSSPQLSLQPPPLPWLRGQVLIPQQITPGRDRALSVPTSGGGPARPREEGSALTCCVAGGVSPALPSHGCGAQGAPWPCCSPGERQRVLIEFLDYPGGEVVISLNPTSGRVP